MTVNKKMKKPVVLFTSRFISKFGKPDHSVVCVKCVGKPGESTWAYICFGEGDSRNWHIIGDEVLLFGMHSQVKSFLPVLACHFAHCNFMHDILLLGGSKPMRFQPRWTEAQHSPSRG